MQTFESVLSKFIGPLGVWQWFTFALIELTVFCSHSIFPQLASLTPSHRCAIPSLENTGLTSGQIRNYAIPSRSGVDIQINATEEGDYQNCHQYILLDLAINHSSTGHSINQSIDKNKTIPCTSGWTYDESTAKFRNSFTRTYDLVCHRQYYLPLSTTVYFIGSIIGRILGGFLADHYGRKLILMSSSLLTCVLGVTLAFSPNILVFCILRFLIGIVSNSSTICAIVLWSEITNDKYRNTLGFLYGIRDSFVSPSCVIVLAYLMQDWRYFHIALSACYGLGIFYPFLIMESPRWLLSSRKMDKAFKVIRRATRLNGRSSRFSEQEFKLMEKELWQYYKSPGCPDCHSETNTSWRDNKVIVLLTRPYLRRRILPFLFIWIVIMGSIMGLQFYAVRMKHSNPYLVAFVGCTFALPGLICKQFLYHFFDRKRPLIAVFSIAGIVCVIGAGLRAANLDGPWNAALATIALGCALVAQNMCYALTAEAFPTMYRSYAMGLVSGVGRAGAALSTFVERLDVYVWSGLPLTIFGALSLLAAVVVHFVPAGGLEENEMDVTKSLKEIDPEDGCPKEMKVLMNPVVGDVSSPESESDIDEQKSVLKDYENENECHANKLENQQVKV